MLEDLLFWFLVAFFFIFPFFWLRTAKEYSWEKILQELFPKFLGWRKEIIGSTALFAALFTAFIILSNLLIFFGINDLEKVNQSIDSQLADNATIFLTTLIIILFAEEFFFRAFLIKRIGVIFSTLIFTLLHIGYGSISELIGVFFLGLILAYWYKKNNSLIQNYSAHLIYDLIAIMLYLFF
jgi:membrane protease YdiL (CAAX protease family)